MKRVIKAGFFNKIVLPAMLAIVLFVISLFAFVIPTFEKNAVEQKKQMLHELTNTAWSILVKYSNDASGGLIALDEAQRSAVEEIEALRYGREDKDYFWITDLTPVMIMHPYVQELTGQSLQDFADPDGKKLFIEAAEIARNEGEGFISYKWQVRDDSTRVVPKLSFVKRFTPWDWVIGTGIYMDDVQSELSSLTNKLLLILLMITVIISLIIFFITYQSLRIENRRRMVEEQLRESREKYRSLLESSTEGIILLQNSQIAYTNSYIQNWLGYTSSELQSMTVDKIIPASKLPDLDKVESETRVETSMIGKGGMTDEALLTILPVRFADKEGLLLTFRDISEHRSLKTELDKMKERVKTMSEYTYEGINHFAGYVAAVATLNNTAISGIAVALVTCPVDSTIGHAVDVMNRGRSSFVLMTINQAPAGIITKSDLLHRFLAGDHDFDSPASGYMSSPLVYADGGLPVAEAAALMERKGVSHIVLRGTGGVVTGVAGIDSIARIYLNSASVIEPAIASSFTTEELLRYRKKLPFLVKPLLREVGDVTTFSRILSGFNETITVRVIENAIREQGKPPVPFTFFTYGSAGRDELTFNSDQDNGIIYAGSSEFDAGELQRYFLGLGSKICEGLNETGLIRCSGGFMASNSKWCRSVDDWLDYFREWIVNAEPENLLNFSVFFDLKHVYGDEELFGRLEDFIFEAIRGRSAFFYFLAQSITSVRPPAIVTTHSTTESARKKEEVIDIKACMAPLVMFVRIFALHNNIRLRNTADRLSVLCSAGSLSKQTCDDISYIYNFLSFHRMQNQLSRIMAREEVTNDVVVSDMTEMEQSVLKKSLARYGSFNEILGAEFMSAFKG